MPTFSEYWANQRQLNPHAPSDPLPVCGQTLGSPAGDSGPPAAVPTRLDPKETSVSDTTGVDARGAVIDFDRWSAEKGTPDGFFAEHVFDESSASARFRHASWWRIRRRVWDALVRTAAPASRRSAFGACGSCSWVERSDANPDDFRIRYNHCKDRMCTPCANTRAARISAAVMQRVADTQPLFITLTLCGKNEPLSGLVDRLYKSFKALRLMPLWADAIRGGVAFLEVKHNTKAGRWHPHLHILADGKYVPKGELSDVWRSITKDSYIVDVQRCKPGQHTAAYVTKYASKPLNTSFCNTAELLDEALKALHGRRLAFAFGDWYGTSLNDLEDDELFDDAPERYVFFCSLEELITRANHGSRDALDVIKRCNAESVWRASLLIDTS